MKLFEQAVVVGAYSQSGPPPFEAQGKQKAAATNAGVRAIVASSSVVEHVMFLAGDTFWEKGGGKSE